IEENLMDLQGQNDRQSVQGIPDELLSEKEGGAAPSGPQAHYEEWDAAAGESDLKRGSSFSDRDVKNLQELINELGETFHEMLFRKINESKMTDAQVYKRANIDRRFFSKIRNNPAYHPGKRTVLALAVALKLDISEAADFLSKAGYAFSPASKGDLIVKYFIEREMYDIQVINYALYEFGEPLLGDDRGISGSRPL
ncbi:MAG: helix-turn-helix transcriptional regulator, partial [Clostridiales bacterium]|nr:helix-turn-helix transcriptional regulator [Clostridiales bacterium]